MYGSEVGVGGGVGRGGGGVGVGGGVGRGCGEGLEKKTASVGGGGASFGLERTNSLPESTIILSYSERHHKSAELHCEDGAHGGLSQPVRHTTSGCLAGIFPFKVNGNETWGPFSIHPTPVI